MKFYVDYVDDRIVRLYMNRYNLTLEQFCEKCHINVDDFFRAFKGDGAVYETILHVIHYFAYFAMLSYFVEYYNFEEIIRNSK